MQALILDDSRAMRMILKKILQSIGFDCFEANDGREGVAFLKSHGRVDLILVDWNMPEMNGYDFLCVVRKNEEYKKTHIMMITTETEINQMAKALQAGANEYVMKPFTREVVLNKLALLGIEESRKS